jgi:membrane fusion protein, multidrug efflux system
MNVPVRSAGAFAALVGLLLAGLMCGCGHAPAAAENPPPAPVKWEPALPLVLEEWTELIGITQPLPDRAARITAPLEGRVQALFPGQPGKPRCCEGQQLEAGTVLVQFDPTIINAAIAKTAAALATLQHEEQQAKIAIKLAQLDVDRLKEARGTTGGLAGASPVEIRKAEIALEDAQSKLRGAESKKEAGQKELDALEAQRRLFTIASPIKGRLGRLQVVQGQTIATGTPIAEVVDVEDQIDVLCFVSSHVARRLTLGQPARLGALAESDAPTADAEGKVAFIAPQAEAETGNLAVKIRFPNRDLKLRPNATTRIRVLTHEGKQCRSLPETALMEDQEPPTVIVVEDIETKKNAEGKEEQVGKARVLQVEIGRRDRVLHQVEIIRLIDPEKDAAKRWKGNLESAVFVVERGHGLQTGDTVKLEQDED